MTPVSHAGVPPAEDHCNQEGARERRELAAEKKRMKRAQTAARRREKSKKDEQEANEKKREQHAEGQARYSARKKARKNKNTKEVLDAEKKRVKRAQAEARRREKRKKLEEEGKKLEEESKKDEQEANEKKRAQHAEAQARYSAQKKARRNKNTKEVEETLRHFYTSTGDFDLPTLAQPGYGPKTNLNGKDVKDVLEHITAQTPTAEQERAMLDEFSNDAEANLPWHICGSCGRMDHNTCCNYEVHDGAELLENEKLSALLIRSKEDKTCIDNMPKWTDGDCTHDLADIMPFFKLQDGRYMNVYRDYLVCLSCGSRWDATKHACTSHDCKDSRWGFHTCEYCHRTITDMKSSDTTGNHGTTQTGGTKNQRTQTNGARSNFEFSLASNTILGDWTRLRLPSLSFFESLALSPARQVGLLVKVGHTGAQYNQHTMRSHVLHLPQEEAGTKTEVLLKEIKAWMSDRIKELPDQIQICFVNNESKTGWDAKFLPSTCGFSAAKLISWTQARIAFEYWLESLPQTTKLVSTEVRASKLFTYLSGDLKERLEIFKREHNDIKNNSEKLHEELGTRSYVLSKDGALIEKCLTHTVRPDKLSEDADGAEREQNFAANTQSLCPDGANFEEETVQQVRAVKIALRRGHEAMSEFGGGLRAILDSQWTLWPLGITPLLTRGHNLRAAAPKWLLEHASQRFADKRVIFYLCNVRQRHAMMSSIASSVKSNPEAYKAWSEFVSDPNVHKILKKAERDQASDEFKEVMRLVKHHLRTPSSRANFTPSKRQAAEALIHATYRMFGPPSVFNTMNFQDSHIMDTIRGCMHATMYDEAETPEERLACSDPKNMFMDPSKLGTTLKDLIRAPIEKDALQMECGGGSSLKIDLSNEALRERAAKWPVSSVKAVIKRMEDILYRIMGVKDTSATKKTAEKTPHKAFGSARAFFAVLECQQKGTLHLHMNFHGGPHQECLRYALSNKEIFLKLKDYFEAVSTETVSDESHLLHLALKTTGKRIQPMLQVPPAIGAKSDHRAFQQYCDALAVHLNVHRTHSSTCTKSLRGQKECRFRYPRFHDVETSQLLLIPDEESLVTKAESDERSSVETFKFGKCEICGTGACDVDAYIRDEDTSTEDWGQGKAASGMWQFPRRPVRDVAVGTLRREKESVKDAARRLIDMTDENLDELWETTVDTIFGKYLSAYSASFMSTYFGYDSVACVLKSMKEIAAKNNTSERRRILQTLLHLLTLPCSNGMIVPHNRTTLAAMRSNVVSEQTLTRVGADAKEQQLGTAYYLCSYKTKNTQTLNSPLSVFYDMRETMKRLDTFGSQAPDAGSATRNVKYTLQAMAMRRLVRYELYESEMIAELLNVKSEWSSHSYAYLNVRAAMRESRSSRAEDVNGLNDEDGGTDHVYKTIDKDDKETHKPVSFSKHYRYRGQHLKNLNLLEYTALVKVVQASKNGAEQQQEYHFDKGHPLHKQYVQVLRQKFHCVVLSGRNPPNIPSNFFEELSSSTDEDNLLDLVYKYKGTSQTGEYYQTLFIPWDEDGKPAHGEEDQDQLMNLVKWFRRKQRPDTDRKVNTARWRMFQRFSAPISSANNSQNIDKVKRRHVVDWNQRQPGKRGAPAYPYTQPMGSLMKLLLQKHGPDRSDQGAHADDGDDENDRAAEMAKNLEEFYATPTPDARFERKQADLEEHKKLVERAMRPFNVTNENSTSTPLPRPRAVTYAARTAEEVKREVEKLQTAMPHMAGEQNGNSCSRQTQKELEWTEILLSRNKEDNGQNDDRPAGAPALLNEGQRRVAQEVVTVLESVKDRKEGNRTGKETRRGNMLLHGGPGSGKSYVLRAVHWIAKVRTLPKVLQAAPTGIAAAAMPQGMTMHALLPDHHSTETRIMKADPKDYGLVWCDEVSMLSAELLCALDERLRHILGSTAPFGGMCIVLSGDFLQLPVVGGVPITAGLLDMCSAKAVKQTMTKKLDLRNASANLLMTFTKFELSTQERCEDVEHNNRLKELREMNTQRPFASWCRVFKLYCPERDGKEPAWIEAPVAVFDNDERARLNHVRGANFAAYKGTLVIRWPLHTKITLGDAAITEDQSKQLHRIVHDVEPILFEYFIPGAPIQMTHNLNVDRKVSNGSSGYYHSIVFAKDSDRTREYTTESEYTELAAEQPPGAVITLEKPPIAVRVCLPDTLVDKGHPRDKTRDSSPIITLTRTSKRDKTGYKLQSTGAFECLKGQATVKVLSSFNVTLNLACTVHKTQGRTCDKLIASISPRRGPTAPAFDSLMVLLTRVRKPDDLRIIPPMESQEEAQEVIDKLFKSMKIDTRMRAFLRAFDNNGNFKKELCTQHLKPQSEEKKDTLHRAPNRKGKESTGTPAHTGTPANTNQLTVPSARKVGPQKRARGAERDREPPTGRKRPRDPEHDVDTNDADQVNVKWTEPLHITQPDTFPDEMIRDITQTQKDYMSNWDLGCLKDTAWLDNLMIDRYVTVLNQTENSQMFICTTRVTTFLQAWIMQKDSLEQVISKMTERLTVTPLDGESYIETAKITDPKIHTILMPSHIHGNHWVLFMARTDTDPPTISCMDALAAAQTQEIKRTEVSQHLQLMSGIALCIDKLRDQSQEARQWKHVFIRTPPQKSDFQCGVFTMLFCKLISCKAHFKFEEEQLKFTRKHIAKEISINSRPNKYLGYEKCPHKGFFEENATSDNQNPSQ